MSDRRWNFDSESAKKARKDRDKIINTYDWDEYFREIHADHEANREKYAKKEYRLLPYQKWLVFDKRHKYKMVGAGVGSGKTDGGSFKVTWKILHETPKDIRGLICANTYTQLMESTLKNLLRMWDGFGIRYNFRRSAPMKITVMGHEILCMSLTDTKGIHGQEYGWIWIDEAWGTEFEAFEICKERLRQQSKIEPAWNKIDQTELWITSTLNGLDWMYREFVEKKKDNYDHGLRIATTFHNPFSPMQYKIDLLRTMDPKRARQQLFAEFVPQGEGFIYGDFFDIHTHAAQKLSLNKLDRNLPLDFFLDFNVNPMCSGIGQVKYGKLWVFDEIVLPTSSTWDVANEFVKRYGWWKDVRGNTPGQIRIFGDATGSFRQSASKNNMSDYDVLTEVLSKHFGRQNLKFMVPSKNPPVRERVNAVCACLTSADNQIHAYFDAEKCPKLIKDFQEARYKKGTNNDIDKRSASGGAAITHPTDAFGYWVCMVMPQFMRGELKKVRTLKEQAA